LDFDVLDGWDHELSQMNLGKVSDGIHLQNSKHLENIEPATITANSTHIHTVKIQDNVTTEQKTRKQKVSNGINLFLSLFTAVGQQRLFPRTIMTKLQMVRL
jgi:hypothetical protein